MPYNPNITPPDEPEWLHINISGTLNPMHKASVHTIIPHAQATPYAQRRGTLYHLDEPVRHIHLINIVKSTIFILKWEMAWREERQDWCVHGPKWW